MKLDKLESILDICIQIRIMSKLRHILANKAGRLFSWHPPSESWTWSIPSSLMLGD